MRHQFTVDVWAGIIGDLFLGPYEKPPRPSGTSCLNFFIGRITSNTKECTSGNATSCVVYAWCSFCPSYSRRKAAFGHSLPRPMDRTKRTGFVASAITRSHTCRLLPVGPFEGHSFREKNQHTGRALAFDSSGCDNSTTHPRNFLAYQKFWRHRARLCIQTNGECFQKVL
jgi:hypothetical protein